MPTSTLYNPGLSDDNRPDNCTCPTETTWQRAYREAYGPLCSACLAAREQASREHAARTMSGLHEAIQQANGVVECAYCGADTTDHSETPLCDACYAKYLDSLECSLNDRDDAEAGQEVQQ